MASGAKTPCGAVIERTETLGHEMEEDRNLRTKRLILGDRNYFFDCVPMSDGLSCFLNERGEGYAMTLEERSAERRRRMVVHYATSFEDAERWDLEFWQSLTPQDRLSALVAIHQDIEAVQRGREKAESLSGQES